MTKNTAICQPCLFQAAIVLNGNTALWVAVVIFYFQIFLLIDSRKKKIQVHICLNKFIDDNFAYLTKPTLKE